MPDIINDEMLDAVLLLDLTSIIDVVSQQILDELIEGVKDIVYDPYEALVVQYERFGEDGGLLGEWAKSPTPTVTGNVIQEEIGERSSIDGLVTQLDIDIDRYRHGSHYWTVMEDIREILTDIVVLGKSGPIFDHEGYDSWWKEPRDFWTPFIAMLDNGEINRLIETEFAKRGIVYNII